MNATQLRAALERILHASAVEDIPGHKLQPIDGITTGRPLMEALQAGHDLLAGTEAAPTTSVWNYGLNEGERIMLRRALGSYSQIFLAQKRQAKALKGAFPSKPNPQADDDLRCAEERLGAIDRLSEKLLKEGTK